MALPTMLAKVRVKEEVTYNEYLGADSLPGSYDHTVECEVPSVSPALEVFERLGVKGGFYSLTPVSGSEYGGTCSLKFPLHGWSSTTPTTNAADHPEARFFRAILGGSNQSGYVASATTTSSDTEVTMIDNAVTSTLFKVGSAISIPLGGGVFEPVFIKQVTDGGVGAHTLTHAVETTDGAASAATTYGSNTCYLSTAGVTGADSFTLEIQQLNAANRMILGGCVPTKIDLEINPKGQLMCSVEFIFCEMDLTSGTALSPYDYTFPLLPVAMGQHSGKLTVGATGVALVVQSLTLSMEQTIDPSLSHAASQGVAGLCVTNRSVSMSYTTEITSSAVVKKALQSSGPIQFTLGTSPGNQFAMLLPSPVNTDLQAPSDSNGRWVQSFNFSQGYTAIDTGSDPATNSPFRVAFL